MADHRGVADSEEKWRSEVIVGAEARLLRQVVDSARKNSIREEASATDSTAERVQYQ